MIEILGCTTFLSLKGRILNTAINTLRSIYVMPTSTMVVLVSGTTLLRPVHPPLV